MLVAVLLGIVALAGCSADAAPKATAADRLAKAKRKLDAASSARFVLTTANVPAGGTALVGGKGVLARPAKFRGDFDVRQDAASATVSIISVGGTVYVKLPFATAYREADLRQFGLADPGKLMDPDTGLSTLLVKAKGAKLGRKTRIAGEVVQEVAGRVPGRLVADLLVNAEPARPVAAKFALTEKTGEVRRVMLTGPFFKAGVSSSLTIVLDRYGEKVTITAPDVASS